MAWDEDDDRGDNEVAALALARYGFSDQATCRMINLSENATYLVEDPGSGRSGVLRVHREGYHEPQEIESELDWLTALRDQTDVSTPVVVPTTDGRRVVSCRPRDTQRHAVLFEVVPGLEPDEVAVELSSFETLGAITARMHEHARSWQRPAGFHRFSWDWQHSLGDQPRWGRWQDGIGVGEEETLVLGRAADRVHERLEEYGTASDRYGLVHADLRLANLLVDGDQVNVIDFDDCGFSWYMYDFGTAVSFLEHDSRVPKWQDAWLRGYRSVGSLTDEDVDMLATFVMLRRLLLVAWMGSHSHSRECQEIGPGYTAGSCELARRYLATDGHSIT